MPNMTQKRSWLHDRALLNTFPKQGLALSGPGQAMHRDVACLQAVLAEVLAQIVAYKMGDATL